MCAKSECLTAILLLIVSVANIGCSDWSSVTLAPGAQISGEKVVSRREPSTHGYAYYGIRYATAKRFEHSTENTDFTYLANESRNKLGPACHQHPFEEPGGPPPRKLIMNEDCLYLDVIIPVVPKSKGPLPVMVWIYGGALQIGDKDLYNGTFLALEMDAVYVAVNYRLSLFGFLSTGDEVLPGNYGLGDCKTALSWVVKHIHKFNGDASKITVFGESAGAMLTSAIYMDPKSRKMLRTALSLSGSVLSDALNVRNPKEAVNELAERVSCSDDDATVMVQCLKKAPVSDLFNAARKMGSGNADFFPYGFVVDNVHIKDDTKSVIQQSPSTSKSTFITGYLREDFSLLIQSSFPQFFDLTVPLTYEAMKLNVAEHLLPTYEKCNTPHLDVAERVMRYYNMSETDGRTEMLLKYFRLASDSFFGYPAMKESFLYSEAKVNGGNNQFYIISYDQKHFGLGAFHAMELGYIFGDEFNKLFLSLTLDESVQKSLLDMMRQIVHDGKMNGPTFGSEGKYMELTENKIWEQGQSDLKALVEFWDNVVTTPCSAVKHKFEKNGHRSDEL